MEQFRALLQERTAERGALARLSQVSGISSPVIGRWRDGIGRPSDTNLKKLAPALGVSYEDLMKMCGYLPGKPASPDPQLDPRLAAFLAEIETGWRIMDQQAREMAERGTRALFRVEDVRRSRRVTKHDEGFDRDKTHDEPFDERPAWMRHPAEQPAQFPPVKRVQRTVTPAPITHDALVPAGVAG